ncbi:MAG: hypothetical protein KCHDKBKB_02101 [Elusimicrobia bacterium]|nr:hypothetical protein [Elusimicrobiota bacterium]
MEFSMDKKLLERITVDPNIQHGKPCIRGTRTPIHVILEAMALGTSIDEIKREYPPLSDDDIHAVLLFAAVLSNEQEYRLSA